MLVSQSGFTYFMRNAQPGTTIISSDSADAGAYEVRLRLLDDRGREICAAERTGP